MTVVIVDTGPLIALFNARDQDHVWATNTLARMSPSSVLLTCDSVISEATYSLGPGSLSCRRLLEAVERGLVRSSFDLSAEIRRVRWFIERYASVPMSFADACLVRMTELHSDVVVWTLDSDFRVYRRHGRERIPTLMPVD